jgi:putative acetyltransferase
MPQTHTLSWATPTDYDTLADIVFDAVRNGPNRYNDAQRAAWVPERRGGPEWAARLEGRVIAIARDDTRFVGFLRRRAL